MSSLTGRVLQGSGQQQASAIAHSETPREGATLSGLGTGMSKQLCDVVWRLSALIEDDINSGATTGEALDVLAQLQQFSLGRFLITKGRLDAEHQFVVSTWPQVRESSSGPAVAAGLHPLERFLLEESPTMRAFQKRHQAMVGILPGLAKGASSLAVVPGGHCEDLTELPDAAAVASSLRDVYHVHVQSSSAPPHEPHAQAAAKLAATPFAHAAKAVTVESWESLSLPSRVDVILTGTLAMNEPGIADVKSFYSQLRSALNEDNGMFVTGFLTRSSNASASVVQLDRMLFRNVIRTTWSEGRDPETVVSQLKAAGFGTVDIVDNNGSYATAVARV